MKLTKLFLAALVGLSLFACSSDDDSNTTSGGSDAAGKKKSVTIKLDGVSTMMTKSVEPGTPNTTAGKTMVLEDLTVVFCDATHIYERFDISSATDINEISTSGKVFHGLNKNVNNVIVLGNAIKNSIVDWTTVTNVTELKALSIPVSGQQAKNNLLLYGNGNLVKVSNSGHTDPSHDSELDLYESEVTITPLVSRFEISGIQCTNLEERYVSLGLGHIGLIDIAESITLGGTASQVLGIAQYDENDVYLSGNLFETGSANPGSVNPFYIFGQDLTWSFEKMSGVSLTSNSSIYNPGAANDEVFAFNFIPVGDNFPKIKLNFSSVNRKPGVPDNQFRYVTAKFTKNGKPQPGYIYTVEYKFTVEKFTPYNPDDRLCIDLTVKVEPWQIHALTVEYD